MSTLAGRVARRAAPVVPMLVALLAVMLAAAGCARHGVAQACPAVGGVTGVGISAVDGSTDAQGRSDTSATLCVGSSCRTARLEGEPNQRDGLVAGFAELPLTGTDVTTVRVTLTRGAVVAAGPYDVAVHPVATGEAAQGCAPPAHVASIVVDAFGAHEGPPPQAPGRS